MYKQIILSRLVEYLTLKDWEMKKRGKVVMLKCPLCNAEPMSANVIPNTSTVNCFSCHKKYNLVDVVRVLEPDKKDMNEEEIYTYLRKLLKLSELTDQDEKDLNLLLDSYVKNGFDLNAVARNSKAQVDKNYLNIPHKNKDEWLHWLKESGLNISMKTGEKSGCTVIDLDQETPDEELLKLLGTTLTIKTSRGWKYLYKYEKDLPAYLDLKYEVTCEHKDFIVVCDSKNSAPKICPKCKGITVLRPLLIEVLNGGGSGACLLPPSTVFGYQQTFVDPKTPIAVMSVELKKFLLDRSEISGKKQENLPDVDINPVNPDSIRKLAEGEGRNSFITSIGGILRKDLAPQQLLNTMQIINQNCCVPPLENAEVVATWKQLAKYEGGDEQQLIDSILAYLEDAKMATRNDIELYIFGKKATGEGKKKLEHILIELMKQEKLIKKDKIYQLITALNWKDGLLDVGVPVKFNVPYFHDYAHFVYGDLVIVGSFNKYGKTTLAMNFVKLLADQGLKPYYIYNETGGRFSKVALKLGMKGGDFHHAFCANPEEIILPKEKNAIIVLDWLRPNDFSETANIVADLVEKLEKEQAFMIAFAQLKADKENRGEFFAPNMMAQFPAWVCKYLYEKTGDGKNTYFDVTDVRDGKVRTKQFKIPCIYDWDTRLVTPVGEVLDSNGKTVESGRDDEKNQD